jgi:two-component system sensor histidine kinase VicK
MIHMRADTKNFVQTTNVIVGSMSVGLLSGYVIKSSLPDGLGGSWVLSGASSFDVYVTLMAVVVLLGLALVNRDARLKGQLAVSKRQELEIDLQRKAMDIHSMVIVSNPDGIISSVNQKFCDTLGFTEADAVGKPVSSLYTNGGLDEQFHPIHQTLRVGKVWSGETKMVSASGETLLIQNTSVPMFDDNGNHIKNVSIHSDITMIRRNENNHFLRNLLDHLHDEVFIFDVESLVIRYMNLRALDRCGWDQADLSEKKIQDTDPKFLEQLFRKHVEPLISGDAEYVTFTAEQLKGPVEVRTRLYIADDGQKLFLSVLRDTTERAQLERARMESVSVVSHELRTPLTSIKGSLRLLNSGALGELSEKAKPILEIADRNSDRLLAVINGILDLEKISAGKVDFHLKRTDLVPFLNDAIAMNQGYADEHGVTITLQTNLVDAWANVDAERLMQVMSNLISNAAKFSPAGGIISVSLNQHDQNLRISVRDDGPGIPARMRSSVFESFSQLDSPDGRKRTGTGLGLAISKSIVKSHDGRIDFESKLGAGSTFFVDLPVSGFPGNVAPILARRAAVAQTMQE